MSFERYRIRVQRTLSKYSAPLTSFSLLASIITLTIFTVFTLSLSATYISVTADKTPYAVYSAITKFVLSLLMPDIESLDDIQYESILSLLLSVMMVGITLGFAVLPALAYIKHRVALRRQASIRSHRVYEDGVDDLRIMREYFRDADEITVYSGDFSWLATDLELQKIILGLAKADNITLVSSKSVEIVKNGITEALYDELSHNFHHCHPKDIKCSFVKRRGNSYFLYKYESSELGRTVHYVYVLRDTMESRYLLDVLGKLCSEVKNENQSASPV